MSAWSMAISTRAIKQLTRQEYDVLAQPQLSSPLAEAQGLWQNEGDKKEEIKA